MDVNVRGFLYAAGAAFPAMQERGGHILDLVAGEEEGAIERAVRSARRTVREELETELDGRGVSVSEVSPGPDSAKKVCRIIASSGE